MVHLVVHLVEEAKLGGPVHYRWMYPIERYLGHLKSYVRNKARPEGSIAEVDYYIQQFRTVVKRQMRGRHSSEVDKKVHREFVHWFSNRIGNNLDSLSGPDKDVLISLAQEMEKQWSDLTPYEVERQRTIEANNKKLEALNIPRLSQSIQKSSSTKKDRMRYVRPGDLQVAANSKRLRSNDIPKPSPRVITPPSSASQDAPPSSPTYDATSHTLTKKGRPKGSQPPHFQFQPQPQHQNQPSPPPSPPQHQLSTTPPQRQPPSPQHQLPQHQPSPQPQHQPSPTQSQPPPPQHQLSSTPPQHQPPPPQHQLPQHQPSPQPQHQPSPTQSQHQSSEPEHEVVLERLPQPREPLPPPPPRNHAHWIMDVIEQFPPEVTKDHWAMYLNYRLSPDTMAKADKNALNRQKQRISHTLGTRSLARTKDIMEQRDGRSYTRGDMYEISHTERNGSYVNDEARQKNEQFALIMANMQNHGLT
ncbi:hypothetical protein P8452_61508 [Trifolium repens]|nr:hypothetical protein P8452_61508 [Trifolium repens]